MALLACCLYKKIHGMNQKLSDKGSDDEITLRDKEVPKKYLERLENIFSLELGRGNPERKPRIIRGSVDQWTLEGEDDDNYKSDVSRFLARFIRIVYEYEQAPSKTSIKLPSSEKSKVKKNVAEINRWLGKVEKAHEGESIDFLPASDILSIIGESNIWSYERKDLSNLILHPSEEEKNTKRRNSLCSLVQLLGFTHYFLQRCCFTTIVPESEDWAFDMFQSLNATGTPLTSLETFKPEVVSSVGGDRVFKNSNSAGYFSNIEELFRKDDSASKKTRLTNDFLTLFGTSVDGKKKPERQFSRQRRWLSKQYKNEYSESDGKEEFIRRMSDTALYWKDMNQLPESMDTGVFSRLATVDSILKEEALLSIQYLQDANHKMASAILVRFYSKVVRDPSSASANTFLKSCKKIAAFFTIWRSALPNTGLDDAYREMLKEKFSWEKGNVFLNVNELTDSLVQILQEKGLSDYDTWLSRAKESLRYDDRRTVCRFALLVTSHETISDPLSAGLMKIGKKQSTPNMLTLESWRSDGLKTIEHVAPQNPTAKSAVWVWDRGLYSETDDFHKVGNLVLLPTGINTSASNKGWKEKFLYYSHLAEKDMDEKARLAELAKDNEVKLAASTVGLLEKAAYSHYIEPIIELGITANWNKDFVDQRTVRICEILWERMREWLEEP